MGLAIVGGSGRLPDLLAKAAPDAPRFAPQGVEFGNGARSASVFRFEQLGNLIERMRGEKVSEVVFAGAIRRPRLDPSALDAFTMQAVALLAPALRGGGDDALLRGVIAVFEREGFEVVAAHAVQPDLLPPPGVATGTAPEDRDRSDAERALAVLGALGPFDIGQGCVVAGGHVLAIEALGGTDWMLGTLSGAVPGRSAGRSGVLCKAPKRDQDRRIDLPTIGPETVAGARAAQLTGIVIEAGGVIVLDRAETVAAAEDAGLFLWVRER